jgi:CofD-related protein of GAK system
MNKLVVTREVKLPDLLRLERYRRLPELGPSILFFSGGSALKRLSRELTVYTKNSIHLLSPFDSGGSSAKLRTAFDMPAVGDIRSRLLALADFSITGNPEVYLLANYRLPEEQTKTDLLSTLDAMISGKHKLVRAIPNPLRRLLCLQLSFFREAMPESFDLRGASIGNLILTGGYLNYQRHLDPILYLFSKLLAVQGMVRAIVSQPYHLVAELENGQTILGQHQFTGKECAPVNSVIKKISLSASASENCPVSVRLRDKIASTICGAELICYPPGSFYSSLIANLLPAGVGQAISQNACPKVFIPNLGTDPEQFGMSGDDVVDALLTYLQADCNSNVKASNLLNYVVIDSQRGDYVSGLPSESLKKHGIELVDTRLISDQSVPYYDNTLLAHTLLSLT